jgi:hypothetical protein
MNVTWGTIYRIQRRRECNKRWCHTPWYFATKLEAERWVSDHLLEYPQTPTRWRVKHDRGWATHVYPKVQSQRIEP